MALEQRPVWEIVRQSVSQEVDIPEFQRPFVWEPEQVKLLAESLYRGYPIGAFLLWSSFEYRETRTAKGSSEATLWIVDGQQRTSAFCILFGKKPYWWTDTEDWNKQTDRHDIMVEVLPSESDRVAFGLPNKERRDDAKWISLRKILQKDKVEDLTSLAQEIVHNVSSDTSQQHKYFGLIHANLHGLWQIRERQIPIIEISHEVEDVAEIFARLNREGTLIREADVILALAAVRNAGWVRDHYLPFVRDLDERGWDLGAGVFIRTMTGIGHGRGRLKEVPRDFWNPPEFLEVWEKARTTISETIKRLGNFGIFSTDLVPSKNSLIPLFVAHHIWGTVADYRFERIFRWFLLVNRDGRYAGAAITSLDEDLQSIQKAKNFDEALAGLLRRLRVSFNVSADEFLARYDRAAGRGFLRLMLYLALRDAHAVDWVDRTQIGYESGSAVAVGFKPNWHHIFPKSMLANAGVKDDDIQFFGNITVLNERTNVTKLAAKHPSRYLHEFDVTPELLRSHQIPEPFATAVSQGPSSIDEQWSALKYPEFVFDRSEAITEAVNAFLDSLK